MLPKKRATHPPAQHTSYIRLWPIIFGSVRNRYCGRVAQLAGQSAQAAEYPLPNRFCNPLLLLRCQRSASNQADASAAGCAAHTRHSVIEHIKRVVLGIIDQGYFVGILFIQATGIAARLV